MKGTLILGLENVKAYYARGDFFVKAVDGITLNVYKGETVGIVGESGSGKSTLSNVMIMNIKKPLTFIDGKVTLNVGANFLELNNMPRQELQKIVWGRETSIIPQSAMNALMPTKKIRDFISDLVKDHFERALNEEEIVERAKQRFTDVGISPNDIYRYPFELSGGMRQRAVIAIATLLNPRLLICDEPTSALDVANQKLVLKTLEQLRRREIVESIVFITHDIATVRQIATRMVVMYAGKIVENSPTDDIIKDPLHPYTKGLLLSVVTPEPEIKKRGISFIPGTPPDLANPPIGCRFHTRCPYKMPICEKEEPPLIKIDTNREVACFLFNK